MNNLIALQVERLNVDFSLSAVTASEIEFYLHGASDCADLAIFWQEVSARCASESIPLFKTDKENGKDQFEVALMPSEPAKTAVDTAKLTGIIASVAPAHHMTADFSAKPADDQPGSGLHIHLQLLDAEGKSVFYKDDDSISPSLAHSIGGLLEWLNPCMGVFAPHEQSYRRFHEKCNAPMTVSWGANNRTVAIRLPDADHDNKRIEHRVAGSDADPSLVMAVILAAIHYGLKNGCQPGAQVYGDAALPMYHLPPLLYSLDAAIKAMHASNVFSGYFSVSDLLPARQ